MYMIVKALLLHLKSYMALSDQYVEEYAPLIQTAVSVSVVYIIL